MYSYRISKAAANMLGANLHHQPKPQGVAVVLLHPGAVKTQMTKGVPGWEKLTAHAKSAAGLAAQLDKPDLSSPVEFRHATGKLLPW